MPNLDEEVFDELPPLEPDEIETSAVDLEGLDLSEETSLDDAVHGDEAAEMQFEEGPVSAERDADPMPGDFGGDLLVFDESLLRDDAPSGAAEDVELSFLDVGAGDDAGEEGPSIDADAIEEHSLPPIDAGDDDEREAPRMVLADGALNAESQGPAWAVVSPRIPLSGCYEVAPIARGAVVASQTGLFRVDLEGARELLLAGHILSIAANEGTTACVDDAGNVYVRVGAGHWAMSAVPSAREVRLVGDEVLVLTEGGTIQTLEPDETSVNDGASAHPLRQPWPSSVVAWSVSSHDVLFAHAVRSDRVRVARRSPRGEDPLFEFEGRPELVTAVVEVDGEVALVIDGRLRIAGHGDVSLPGRVIALSHVEETLWLALCEDRAQGALIYSVSPKGERTRLLASVAGVGTELEPNSICLAASSKMLVWVAGTFGIVAASARNDAQSPS